MPEPTPTTPRRTGEEPSPTEEQEINTSHPLHRNNWQGLVPNKNNLHERLEQALKSLSEERAQRNEHHKAEHLMSKLRRHARTPKGAEDIIKLADLYEDSKPGDIEKERTQLRNQQIHEGWDTIRRQGTLDDVLEARGPNAHITPMEATQYAREQQIFISHILNQVDPYLPKNKKYLEMITQAQDNIAHAAAHYGADWERLQQEGIDWGVGVGRNKLHGTAEHMEAALAEDDNLQKQTDEYDRLMTNPNHPRMKEAWNDQQYRPNNFHVFSSQGQHFGTNKGRYDPEQIGTFSRRNGMELQGVRHDQPTDNRYDHTAQNADQITSSAPHVLGATSEEQAMYNEAHQLAQNHTDALMEKKGLNPAYADYSETENQREVDDSHARTRKALEHLTDKNGLHPMDHPDFGVPLSKVTGSRRTNGETYDENTQLDPLTKQPPKHPHTQNDMSYVEGLGWVDHNTVQEYQNKLKPHESVFAQDMVHDENGQVIPHMGLHIDHKGVHGADLRLDGPFDGKNLGAMNNQTLRQRQTGHVMDRAMRVSQQPDHPLYSQIRENQGGLHKDRNGATANVIAVKQSPQTLTSLGDSRYSTDSYQQPGHRLTSQLTEPTTPVTPPSMRQQEQRQQPAAEGISDSTPSGGGSRGGVMGALGGLKRQYDTASKRSWSDILEGKNPTGTDNLEKLIKHVQGK